MLKFEEITREEKNTKIGGNSIASCCKPIHHYKSRYTIIDNISLPIL
jgi:hypothetical protein